MRLLVVVELAPPAACADPAERLPLAGALCFLPLMVVGTLAAMVATSGLPVLLGGLPFADRAANS